MRIGILTFHRAYNCGAMLQAWALQTVLKRLGHQVVFPDCNSVGEDSPWPVFRRATLLGKIRNFLGWLQLQIVSAGVVFRMRAAFARFRDRCLDHVEIAPNEIKDRCDLIVVGSDQVWSRRCAGKDYALFLGGGIDASIPLIGYALSAGDESLCVDQCAELQHVAQERFARVSFRERALADQVCVGGEVVCDPTLLLERKDYATIESKARLVEGDYLLLYGISDVAEVANAALAVARQLHVKLVTAGFRMPSFRRKPDVTMFDFVAPDVLLALVRDSKYVIASSFHGCAFSVIYHKCFLNLYGASTSNPNGRQQQLFTNLGLSGHRFDAKERVDVLEVAIQSPYEIGVALLNLRMKSLDWLKDALTI